MTDDKLNSIEEYARTLPNPIFALDVEELVRECRRLRAGLALAWSDGWQAAFDRPVDAEEAIRFRDLKHFRDVQAIIDGTTVD